MIAALWSNSNYDGDGKEESPRQAAIADIEERCDNAVTFILTGKQVEEENEIDESNPFFIAMRRGQAKLEQPRDDEGTVAQAIDYTADTDQA